MPQRMKDFGRISTTRIYQTITTTGDVAEGEFDVGATETNILEMVSQNFKNFFIESRNADTANTCTFKIYASRKFNESVPATGDAFWTATGIHWYLLDTQAAVAITSNAVVKEYVDKGYNYLLVTAQGSGAGTGVRARAVFTTY